MDILFLGNALLFMGAFALQYGVLDMDFAADDDEDSADTEGGGDAGAGDIWDEPAYDPADFGDETAGTAGDDSLNANSSPLSEAFFLGDGNDELDATMQDDYADGGAGDDTLTMRLGDDIALGGDGNDSIDGGLGNDSLYGEAGDDWITGSKGDDLVSGGDGADTLMGSEGDDLLNGGAGDDVLYGNLEGDPGDTEDGADTLLGGEGDDALHLAGGDIGTGGAGADSFLIHDPGDSGATASVADYDPSEDVLAVVYTPRLDPDTGAPITPELTVEANAAGDAGIVYLDGVEIARIAGGQALTAADISLIPDA